MALVEFAPQFVFLVSMISCVGLFLVCRWDWVKAINRQRAEIDILRSAVKELHKALTVLEIQTETRDNQNLKGVAETIFRSPFNLDRRMMAVRLHYEGDHPRDIALAVGMPLHEVEFVLKVHQTRPGDMA